MKRPWPRSIDQHDDDTATLAIHIEQVIATCNLASEPGARKISSRRPSNLITNESATQSAISTLTGE